MTELDKFKRRTIRSVARLLLKEKKPPEELWAEMKKETGTDCRVLWERMRALCIKKLNRMIAADDRSASLPSIARLTLTDWLLVDLVLVHEEIDVIAMDEENSKEFPALIELFNLVQRFDIEGRLGESLAEAWAAATVFYNRQGRQCSPMLLQRRWYQLKKLTRCRFYKFWFSYRGNTRYLDEARKCMPTRLQMAIAKRYPKMITAEFPDWEDMIEKGNVIMPEKFEAKMRMPNLPKPCSSDAPDLVLVEPVIETIDLRVESDHEDHDDDEIEDTSDPEKSNDATDVINHGTGMASEGNTVNNDDPSIKNTESVEEDGLSNVQLISATHVPEVEIPDESPDESPEVMSPSPHQSDGKVKIEDNQEDNPDDDEDDLIEIPSIVPTDNHTDDIVQIPTAEVPSHSEKCDVDIIVDSDEAVDDIIKVKADEFCRKSTEEDPVENCNTIDDLIKDKVDTFLKTPKDDISFSEKKPDVSKINIINKADIAAIDLLADLNFIDEGIEFVDDGVEFVEEDDTQKTESAEDLPPVAHNEESGEETNKFDLKLLMYPVVYTTKLDQMKIFTNKEFNTIENKVDIEMALIESKPVSKQTFSVNIKQERDTNINEEDENKADIDDLFTNPEAMEDEELDEDEDLDENEKVSPNSYLLKKPKTRTYDLIKLCKNPDFNTKLKRLTIGFLSSTRNRQFLKACIPMTIDLSKAFESKLVNKTLYLKSSGAPPHIIKHEAIEDKQASSIVPSAMPVQSLIDNSIDINKLITNQSPPAVEPIVSERTKVINLPDIDKVRQINQKLLTAQVTPLRVYAGNSYNQKSSSVPISSTEVSVIEKPTSEVNPIASSAVSTVPNIPSIDPGTSLNIFPAKVKIENEKSENDNITPTETLPPAKEKLVKMINMAKISTQEALAKIDDGTKQDDFPMPIQVQEVKSNLPTDVIVGRKPYGYQPRVPLAWAPKYMQAPKKLDNLGLLTADTLNKMLHLLTSGTTDGKSCKCCMTKTKAKVMKRKLARQEQKKAESETTAITQDGNVAESIEKDEAVFDEAPVATQKPPTKKKTSKAVALGRVVKYCCWAKQKICNRKRITRHECLPGACRCCCADELVVKIKKDEEESRKERERLKNKDGAIELSDEEDESLRKACESIENVVQQSRQITKTPVVHTMIINPIPAIDSQGSSPEKVSTMIINPVTNIQSPGSSPEKVPASVAVSVSDLEAGASTSPPKTAFVQTVRAAPMSSLMAGPTRVPTPRLHVVPTVRAPPRRPHWALCTCQSPAVGPGSRGNIVIDASVMSCARHPAPHQPAPAASAAPLVPLVSIAPKTPGATNKEKILYLHSKSMAKSPSENPIYLGKNKILLTTVKFPRKDEAPPPPAEAFPAAKIIPTLPLPAGVQLVLMPSGEVTYTLDPSVELDEAQLAVLPTILAAVQEQLKTTGIPSTVVQPQIDTVKDAHVAVPQPESISENINLTPSGEVSEMPRAESIVGAETTESSEKEAKEISQDPEQTPMNTDIVEMDVDNANVDALTPQKALTDNQENVIIPVSHTTDEMNGDPETPKHNTEPVITNILPPSVAEGPQVNETQSLTGGTKESNESENIHRKSLLSDLMEMSGISAEDAVAPEPAVPEPPITTVQNPANVSADNELKNLPELSPVTSFAELKYACEQDGKFFKLDFESGIIVPINVCIKKNTKKNPFNINTKECIDLTDDADSTDVMITKKAVTPVEETSPQLKAPVAYNYKGKTVSVSTSAITVKPVKLFKAFRPSRPAPSMLKMRFPTVTRISESLLFSKKTHNEKRKARVEARIDLVNSDEEPMEEEYLVDSSDDESAVEPMLIEALDPTTQSDDSSDDEPLAKKSKRLKQGPEKPENVKETNIYDELPEPTVINSFLTSDPDEIRLGVTVRNDLGEMPEPGNSGSNPAAHQDSPSNDVPSTSGISNVIEKGVKNDIGPVVVRSDSPPVVVVREEFLNTLDIDVDGASEDEEMDKAQPEIRFMSDPSDGESAEDCILGV